MYYPLLKTLIKSLIGKLLNNTTLVSLILSLGITQAYIWINNNRKKFIGEKFKKREIFNKKIMNSYNHMYMRHRFINYGIVSRNGILAIRIKEINAIKKFNLPKPIYVVINKAILNILRIRC